ncbi:MAG TPA: nucleotide exchange factor GrpE [Desulfofustis sp.]|jgi:molecular chaperone GrpE|nr:nucleotide exchange factor GrpE [Desulfofustis sp.]HBH31258.1 nucleotide exchange factor GrpE [Desulfofustis sp.]
MAAGAGRQSSALLPGVNAVINNEVGSTNSELKEQLVERFRTYLDNDFTIDAPSPRVDRMSLFQELEGLRNEVRIESRRFKGALDNFNLVFSSLDASQQDIVRMLRAKKLGESDTIRTALEPVMSGLIELYDRLAAGLRTPPPAPSFIERLLPRSRRKITWFESFLEGQRMVVGRTLDLLQRCGVEPVKTAGEQFDPAIMKAISFRTDACHPDNTVLEEVRTGFMQGGKIVRVADVVVNKRGE